jgi:serine/threonine-protein kinase
VVPFRVLESLSKGEIADVLLVSIPPGDRVAVVKRLREDLTCDDEALERFEEEVRLIQRLRHPNIVQLLDAGVANGVPYFMMERLEGGTLGELLDDLRSRQLPLRPSVACGVAGKTARALAYAHQEGVVHRDVAPDNIFLTSAGEVKLLDFGIARLAAAVRTRSGTVRGKVWYMAPEQIVGLATGPATDLFALGLVLWEMLVGRRPFPAAPVLETMRAIREDAVPPPSTQASGVPRSVDALVMALIAKFPGSRPQRAIDVAVFVEQAARDLGLVDLPGEIALLLRRTRNT